MVLITMPVNGDVHDVVRYIPQHASERSGSKLHESSRTIVSKLPPGIGVPDP